MPAWRLARLGESDDKFFSLELEGGSKVHASRLWENPPEVQIKRVFGKDADIAIAIAKAESGMRCDAIGTTRDYGIFQLHDQPIMDCTQNILRAKEMFDRRGFQPWVTFNQGIYKRYLNETNPPYKR